MKSDQSLSNHLIDYTKIKDVDAFISTLEALYNEAIRLLGQGDDNDVIDIFEYLFKNDIHLKERLSRAFMPQSDDDMIEPDQLGVLTEVQGTFTFHHLNLFNAITDRVIELYRAALEAFEENFEEGSRLVFMAQKTGRYYEVKIDKLIAPLDTFQGALYNDLKESYKVVTSRRDDSITQIAQLVVMKETQIRQQFHQPY